VNIGLVSDLVYRVRDAGKCKSDSIPSNYIERSICGDQYSYLKYPERSRLVLRVELVS
jgi:hypothetical protein